MSETALIPDEYEERENQVMDELNQGIVNRAIKIMADRDVVQLGELMYEAEALFNNHVVLMSPEELKAPKLRAALSDSNILPFYL